MSTEKIGLGGGCHWCTEAVFNALKGVLRVEQGWIASEKPYDSLSEAVIVHFDPSKINLDVLTEIHLLTHASTSNHSMRRKYRSAIYTFKHSQKRHLLDFIKQLSHSFEDSIVTKILPFKEFKASPAKYQDYYNKNVDKPFCRTYINPKIRFLMDRFRDVVS